MNGLTELQVFNIFLNLIGLSLVFGTIYGFVSRGFDYLFRG